MDDADAISQDSCCCCCCLDTTSRRLRRLALRCCCGFPKNVEGFVWFEWRACLIMAPGVKFVHPITNPSRGRQCTAFDSLLHARLPGRAALGPGFARTFQRRRRATAASSL